MSPLPSASSKSRAPDPRFPAGLLDDLAYDLVVVQTGTVIPNLKVLLAFREDSLVKMSNRLVRRVVGSAQLPPSVELERLTRLGARVAFLAGLQKAGIGLDPRQEPGEAKLEDAVLADIQKLDDRIYPPHLQMVAETLCERVSPGNPIITRQLYSEQCGGADRIIAEFLLGRLKEFGSQRPDAESVLKALTSSEGKKAKRSVAEVARATSLSGEVARALLSKMVDLRMARALDEDEYEIIHDHLGKMVDEALVTGEERDVKFIQEQLDASQRLFAVHRTPISSASFLASLYRNRRRVVVDPATLPLLLCTHLWVAGQRLHDRQRRVVMRDHGCCWYWLRRPPHSDLFTMTLELLLHDEEVVWRGARELLMGMVEPGDIGRLIPLLKDDARRVRQAATEAFCKVATRGDLQYILPLLEEELWVLRQAAAAAFGKVATRDDLEYILPLLKDDDGDVRVAAVEAVGKVATHDDLEYVLPLLKDEDSDARQAAAAAFGKVATRDDLRFVLSLLKDGDLGARTAAGRALTRLTSDADAEWLLDALAEGVHGWDQLARSHFIVLSALNDKLYSVIPKATPDGSTPPTP